MDRRTRVFGIPGDLEWLRALGIYHKGPWTRDAIERRLAYLESCIEHNLIPDVRERCLSQHGRSAVLVISQPLASDDLGAAAQQMDRIEVLMRDTCEAARRAIAMRQHLASENLVTAAQRMECVTASDGLAVHMEDLCEAVGEVRQHLASDDLGAAAQRMDRIEMLVRDMCDRVSRPHAERGEKVINGSGKGGDKRRGKLEPRTRTILSEMARLIKKGSTVRGAADATARRGIGKSGGANRALFYRHKPK